MELNRKRITKELKFNILKDHFEKGTSISELARLNGIHPITIYQWKRKMSEKPIEKINIEELLKENEQLKKNNVQLTKALGQTALENQCLKDLNEFLKKKSQEQLLKSPKSFSKKRKKSTPK